MNSEDAHRFILTIDGKPLDANASFDGPPHEMTRENAHFAWCCARHWWTDDVKRMTGVECVIVRCSGVPHSRAHT